MNPARIYLGLLIISSVAVHRAVVLWIEGASGMSMLMGERILPIDLFHPSKIPKEAPI